MIGKPIVQDLGMQGEQQMVKVSFPLHNREGVTVAHHSIILKMKAEDLPQHGLTAETTHFNVGRLIKEKYNG